MQKPLPTKFSDETGNYDGNDPQGSANLTFTRASNATRVGPDGLIHKVRTNVFSFSEDFSTSAGFFANTIGASTATFTANYGTAPDGTQTADRIQLALNGTSYADWVRVFGVSTGVSYTYSIYLKSLSGTTTIQFINDGTANIDVTLTADWARYDFTWTASSATIYPRFLLGSGTSASADVLAWGAMVEVSDFGPTDYIATTTAAVSVGPVSGLPRLDYSGGATCPSLKLEPQRTNLATNNERLATGTFSYTDGVAFTANSIIAPTGLMQGCKFEKTGSGVADRYDSFSAQPMTQSIFVKAGTASRITLAIEGNNTGSCTFNLSTLGIVNGGNATGKIVDYGNGWYRCIASYTLAPTSGPIVRIFLNDSGYLYCYGYQIEPNATYATSLIPTLSTSVTRVADDCRKSNTFLSGQTVACAFVDYTIDQVPSDYAGIFEYRNNSTLDFYMLQFANTTSVEFRTRGTNGVENTVSASIPVGRNKVAMYRNGDRLAVFANGVKVADQTSGTAMSAFATTSENLYLNYDPAFANYGNQLKVSQMLLFAGQTFTDAQLAELTA